MDTTTMISEWAGRPYGHTPGHEYLDCEVELRDCVATLVISWGSAQGYGLEESGREEYTRRGTDSADAVERVRDAALDEEVGESRRYVETAASRALRALAGEDAG